MPEFITVKAAYGKELNSEKEVLQHYLDGKDFMVLSYYHNPGTYINKTDCERAKKPISLEVRFGKKGQKLTLLDTTNPAALQKKLDSKIKQSTRNGKNVIVCGESYMKQDEGVI